MQKESKLKEVVITGMWGHSSVGESPEAMVKNISQGKSGIRHSNRYSYLNLDAFPIGSLDMEVDDFEKDNVHEWSHKESIKAIENALKDANLSIDSDKNEEIGLVVASSTLKVLRMQEFVIREKEKKTPIPLLLMGDGYLQNLANHFNIMGEVHNVSTACSSGAGAICVAMDAIMTGAQETMIVVSADPLVELSLSGFASLQSLSDENSTPFDVKRHGINLGEASAAVILEEKEKALARGAKIYCDLLAYSQGNDAYSLTAPDPEGKGAEGVMREALKWGGISSKDVGYINTHGTGTKLNDSMELKAIEALGFDCYVSSTKGFTGHCLATAGLLELVLSIESYRQKQYLPNFKLVEAERLQHLLERDTYDIPDDVRPYILSNSFAFGGNSASILLRMN